MAGQVSSTGQERQSVDGVDVLAELGSEILEITDDFDSVMQGITDKARQLLRCEIAYVVGLDRATDQARLVAKSGLSDNFPKTYPTRHEGLVGSVYHELKPVVCYDYTHDPRRSNWIAPYVEKEGMKSIVQIPLITGEGIIGILVVSSCSPRRFTEHDIRLAVAFANLASIALKNSAIYTSQKAMIAKMELLNKKLGRRNRAIQLARHVHDQFIDAALQGGDMVLILDTLVKIVGRPFILEDKYGEIMAVRGLEKPVAVSLISPSEPGLVRLAERNVELRVQIESLIRGKKRAAWVHLSGAPMRHGRLVVPIIAGDSVLGYLSEIESRPRPGRTDIATIEYAAIMLALEMMKQRSIFESEQRLLGDFFGSLLFGNAVVDERLFKRASYLGYNLNGARRALTVMLDGPESTATLSELRPSLSGHLLRMISTAVREISPESAVMHFNDSIVILVKVDGQEEEFPISSATREVAAAAKAAAKRAYPDLSASIGVGCLCIDPGQYKQSCEEARKSLEIARLTGRHNVVVSLRDFGLAGLLFDTGHIAKLASSARDLLNPIVIYAKSHNSDLMKTLNTYLQCNCSPKKASELLFIHENTLRHRVEKIEELCGIDLTNFDDKLTVGLALKIEALQIQVSVP